MMLQTCYNCEMTVSASVATIELEENEILFLELLEKNYTLEKAFIEAFPDSNSKFIRTDASRLRKRIQKQIQDANTDYVEVEEEEQVLTAVQSRREYLKIGKFDVEKKEFVVSKLAEIIEESLIGDTYYTKDGTPYLRKDRRSALTALDMLIKINGDYAATKHLIAVADIKNNTVKQNENSYTQTSAQEQALATIRSCSESELTDDYKNDAIEIGDIP